MSGDGIHRIDLPGLSHVLGGQGRALKNKKILGQLSTPISIGKTPGPGTLCTVFLATNFDTAYNGAVIQFIVQQFGRSVIFASVTIASGDVAAQPALEYTVSGCAADFWEATLTLNNGTTPALPLQSALVCSGVENLPFNGGGGGGGGITAVDGTVPIEVSTVGGVATVSIDADVIPWIQVGGVGGTIEAVDPTASVQAANGTATGPFSVAFATGTASGTAAMGIGGGAALADSSLAVGGGQTDVGANNSFAANPDSQTQGQFSTALCGGLAVGQYCLAVGQDSAGVQSNANSTANGSCALYGGATTLDGDFAVGQGSTASGGNSFAICGGTATIAGGAAIGQVTASQGLAWGGPFNVGLHSIVGSVNYQGQSVTVTAATYAVLGTDYVIRGDATAGAISMVLPSPSAFEGQIYFIKKIDASGNTVTVVGGIGRPIDGSVILVLSAQYQAVQVQSNGAGWDILSAFP